MSSRLHMSGSQRSPAPLWVSNEETEQSMRQPSEPSSSERNTALADAVQRARAEFLEMPGLRLTLAQAARE